MSPQSPSTSSSLGGSHGTPSGPLFPLSERIGLFELASFCLSLCLLLFHGSPPLLLKKHIISPRTCLLLLTFFFSFTPSVALHRQWLNGSQTNDPISFSLFPRARPQSEFWGVLPQFVFWVESCVRAVRSRACPVASRLCLSDITSS